MQAHVATAYEISHLIESLFENAPFAVHFLSQVTEGIGEMSYSLIITFMQIELPAREIILGDMRVSHLGYGLFLFCHTLFLPILTLVHCLFPNVAEVGEAFFRRCEVIA